MSRVGIYSGTFDPVHHGHIAFCRAAVQACKLENVWLLPERQPREKTSVTPFDERVHMLQLAVVDDPALQVLQLPHEQFTVGETLPVLTERFAGDELFFLVGSDVVQTFTYRWDGLRDLLKSVCLIIGMREGDSKDDVQTILQQVQIEYSVPLNYTIIESPKHHMASLRIRRQQHAEDELDPRVAAYIADQRLYKS
jgi:nicotinate-nucleotide adenylyltransferase